MEPVAPPLPTDNPTVSDADFEAQLEELAIETMAMILIPDLILEDMQDYE